MGGRWMPRPPPPGKKARESKETSLFAPGRTAELAKERGRVIGKIKLRGDDGKLRTRAQALALARSMDWWRPGARVVANDARCHVVVLGVKDEKEG